MFQTQEGDLIPLRYLQSLCFPLTIKDLGSLPICQQLVQQGVVVGCGAHVKMDLNYANGVPFEFAFFWLNPLNPGYGTECEEKYLYLLLQKLGWITHPACWNNGCLKLAGSI